MHNKTIGYIIEVQDRISALFVVMKKFFPDHPQDMRTWKSLALAHTWANERSDCRSYYVTKGDSKGIEIVVKGQSVYVIRKGRDYALGIFVPEDHPTFEVYFVSIKLFLADLGVQSSTVEKEYFPILQKGDY